MCTKANMLSAQTTLSRKWEVVLIWLLKACLDFRKLEAVLTEIGWTQNCNLTIRNHLKDNREDLAQEWLEKWDSRIVGRELTSDGSSFTAKKPLVIHGSRDACEC